MKVDRKPKAQTSPPKKKTVKTPRQATPRVNGKHPLVDYDHIPIGIVEASLEGRYVDVNEEFCRILGYSRQELLRLGIKDCTHEDDYAIDLKLYEQLVTGKIPYYRLEKRFLRPDDSEIWVELTRSLVRGARRKPLYTIGVVLDISERKDVERVLRDSSERLRLATGAAQMFMWEWDFHDQSYTLADNFEKVLGFSGGLLPRNRFETIWALSPEEDVKLIADEFEKAIAQQSDLRSLPYRVINPETGQLVWLEISAKIIYDTEGKPERMFGVAQNITEGKNTQDEIAIISRMPEENPNPVMRLTPDGNVLYANSPSRYLLEVWKQQIDQEIPGELRQRIAHSFDTGSKQDIEIEQDGKIFSFTLAPIREAGYVNLYGIDITERKQAEEWERRSAANLVAAAEANAKFRTFFDQGSYFAGVMTLDGTLLEANRLSLEFAGFKRENVIGKKFWEGGWWNPSPALMEMVERGTHEAAEGKIFRQESKYFLADGSERYVDLIITPVRDENGKLLFLAPTGTDITERKRAEQSLQEFAVQQETLYQLTDQLHRVNSLDDVFDAALHAILRALRCDRASILLFDNENVMRFVAWLGLSDAYRKATDGHSPWTPDAKDPQPIGMGDVRTADLNESLRSVILGEGIGSLAFIPLVSNGKLIGKFMIYFDVPHAFNEAELELSLTIAHQIAFGVDRKRVEETLARERELLGRLFETMPVMVSIYDPGTNSLQLNAEFERLLGWKSEDVTVVSLLEALYPDPEYRNDVLQRMAQAGRNEWVEVQVRTRDGRTLDSMWSNISILEDQKLITGIALGIDITERKQTEKRLALLAEVSELLRNVDDPNELMYKISRAVGEHLQVKRALFNEIDLAHDREMVHRDYHHGVESVAGSHKVSEYSSATSAEVASGKTVVNFDSKTDPRTAQDYEKTYAISKERSYVVVPMMRDNRWVASLWVSDDKPRTWNPDEISLLETVAERTWTVIEKLRIDAELRESEQRYRFIVENTSDGIWWVEMTEPIPISLPEDEQIERYYRHAVIRQCNLGLARMYGYDSVEDVIGLPLRVVMPPEDPLNLELSRNFIRSGYRLVDSESREMSRDGHELIFLNNMIGIIEDGMLKGEWGTNRDITERKRAEEALRRNEQMFSTLVDAAPFGVYFIDSEFRLRAINKGSEAVFSGIHPLVGRDFAEVIRVVWQEPFATEVIERFRHTLETGESFISPPIVEERANIEEIEAYDWQIHRITLSDGSYGVVCYFYDLSEQKRMEATVRASQALYRTIARSIPGGGIYVVDKDLRYLVAEGPITEAFGLSREMLEGHTVSEVFPGEHGENLEEHLRRNFAGEIVSYETVHGGRVYWTQQAPLLDSIGQAIIVTLDITERKQAEEALRQSDERFVRFMQHLPGLAWIKDPEGRYVYANAAAEKAFATPRERLYGRRDDDIFPAGVASQFKRNDVQALGDEKGVQVIETLEHADGVLHYSLVSKFPIPGPDGSTTLIGGTAFDITERLRAEEALRESEERFRAILRQATAGIVRKDADGRLLFVNQAFCNMLGYTESDLIGKTIWEFMHPDDVAENKQSYDRLMLEGIPFKLERRLLRQDGSVIWVDASVSPIMDAIGKPQSAVAVEVDITGRKLAEEALQQLNLQLEERVLSRTSKLRSVNQALREEVAERQRAEEAARANEEKLSTLFDLLPVGISFLDPQGRIIQMNSALADILKLSKEQLSDQAYRSRNYIRANGTSMSIAEFASGRALTEGNTIYNVETGVVLDDGEVIWTSVSAAPVDVADVGAVVVTVDITESKRAERALQESRERLQILSQRLVEVQEEERRAIARELHDRVGQTLAALNINLIIINGQLSPESAEKVGARLSDSMKLVAETITLVRDVMSNLRPSVLDDYGLEVALESHLTQFKSRYEMQTEFEKPEQPIPRLGPSIEMTFLRIAQEALMNIARHAQATQVQLSLWQEDKTVCMSIQDNGLGITSWQDANRPGSHGLTIMRERAEAFGGNLKVSSVPGKGTKVEVKIPFDTNDLSQAQKEKRQ